MDKIQYLQIINAKVDYAKFIYFKYETFVKIKYSQSNPAMAMLNKL